MTITSVHNPLVRQLRKLQQPKERAASQLFLVEGTHAVAAALATHWPLALALATGAWQSAHPELAAALEAGAERFEEVSEAALASIAETTTPSGVVAAARRREHDWRAHPIDPGTAALFVLGETLQDPGNVGTIVRTVAAAGAHGLLLSADSADPEQPKVIRASAGAWFRTPPVRVADLHATMAELAGAGVAIVAADARATRTLWQLDLRGPVAFVLGSEGRGLGARTLALATEHVAIPQRPDVESLNVAVSCALLLYEAVRQRSP